MMLRPQFIIILEQIMQIIICCLILVLSPELFAQTVPSANALSFAPPASDSSMVYLSNIFGNVEGVLVSTGSQILGQMMSILNMAILSLGSIVIMYTLVIGTLNTAHEGEFLGKHWSSIWLPVRCCTGLALLVPKASGYNLIQIFVMWFIVQGVGAADKVWNAVLDYMNEGGQLVVAKQSSNSLQQISDAKGYPVYQGAIRMLAGQVCMEGLQRVISTQRDTDMKSKDKGLKGNCTGKVPDNLSDYCNKELPDFIGSVNTSDAKLEVIGDVGIYTLPMPNFKSLPGFYFSLNGKCGKLRWKALNMSKYQTKMEAYGMTQSQIDTMENSRNIAVQQMYDWLSSVAIQMVNNDPQINGSQQIDTSNNVSDSAIDQFGFALQGTEKTICTSLSSACTAWGAPNDGSQSYPVLFSGNEFSNAIATYDSVMAPTLNLIQDMSNQDQSLNLRSFIDDSKNKGWLMAGSYFYNIIALSGSKANVPMQHDTDSGFDQTDLKERLTNTVEPFQSIFKDNSKPLDNIENLINGTNPNATEDHPSNCAATLEEGRFNSSTGYISNPNSASPTAMCASTVYGFIWNSYFLYTPGQPMPSMLFANPGAIQMVTYPGTINLHVSCHNMKFFGYPVCIQALADLLSELINGLYQWFISYLINGVTLALSEVIYKPIISMGWPLLQYALESLNQQSLNPIVNLGSMGVNMINNIMIIYFTFITAYIVSSIDFWPFIIITLIIAVGFPLIASFFVMFFSIGFICAYYVPLIPYMIFTFGTLSWFMAVIEAMVAGPILALGVMTPEGEGILGKAEQGMMILVNVFLRPSMMIIGFVMGSVLTYVFVWVLTEGYNRAADYLLVGNDGGPSASSNAAYQAGLKMNLGTFSMIFGAVTYSVLYVYLYQTVVEKSFELIHILPDQILRWIGGHGEQYGRESKEWGQGAKDKIQKMEEEGTKAISQGPEKAGEKISNSLGDKKGKLDTTNPKPED
ncbi:MAG: hypothetical protein EBY16_04165 [Gammaproteobacteria bacterium]|nr:hypothetical protein [Gammaproteobacteria bacterium]